MDIQGYISILKGFKDFKNLRSRPPMRIGLESDIGIQTTNLLLEFSYSPHLSTYDIYSGFRRADIKMAYKNIHKRVKRLESLELIEPVKVEDTSHGAKFYRISEAGMFRLIFQHALLDLQFMVYLPRILEIHGNFSIFQTFLYPYLKKETIMAIKIRYTPYISEDQFVPVNTVEGGVNFEMIESIFEYLRKCCSQMFLFIRGSEVAEDESALAPETVDELEERISRLKNEFVMRILLYFRHHENTEGAEALDILAQDDKFMNIAYRLHDDFERCFNFAMRKGGRS